MLKTRSKPIAPTVAPPQLAARRARLTLSLLTRPWARGSWLASVFALGALLWLTAFAAACGGRADLPVDEADALTDAIADGTPTDGTPTDAELGDGATDSNDAFDALSDAGIVSLSVDPATLTLPALGTRALAARALLSDGTALDVTASATWSSDTPSVATVSSTGVVTAVAAGTAHIRATLAGVSGTSTVTVPTATVTDVRVDPGTASTTVGGTVTFAATAVLSDGTSTDVTASATWTVTDATIAKVASGIATGVAGGTTTVTASISGKSGSAALTVTAKALTSVQLSPFAPTVGIGVSIPFKATALYADGTSADVTTTASWSSSAPSVVTVVATGASAGNATSVGAGSATISATFGGTAGTTTVTVTPATLSSITVSPSAATVAIGGTLGLKASGTYSDGTTTDLTGSAVWTSSDATIVAVSSGTISALAAGNATVTASFGGKSGTSAITVSAATLLSITLSPAPASLPMGATLSFKASGLYTGGSTRDVTADVTWSVDDATIATISNAAGTAGRATPVKPGSTTVRATLGAVSGSAALTVTAPSITAITVSPNPISLVRGVKTFATAAASYSDGTTVDVTTTCTWSTANTTIANVSNGTGSQGLVTAVAVGTTTLTCSFGGKTGTSPITVTAPAVDTVSVSPIAPTCYVGQTLRFTATSISSAGTSRDVTGMATWSVTPAGLLTAVTGGGGPGGGGAGTYRCAAKGSATVTATYNGISGSTPVTISDAIVVGLQVDPVTATLPIGGRQTYTATAIFSDGSTADVTTRATWVSNKPAVASITAGGGGGGPGGGGGGGQAVALSAGTATITATYSGFSATATLTVTNAVITSITVTPATTTLPIGAKLTFVATAGYSDGTTKDVTTLASWTSSTTTVAQVSDAGTTRGQATALKAGTTTITATYSGLSGKATLTVTSATLASIVITPATTSVSVGATVILKAYAVYSDGTKAEVTASATWSSSDTSVATVSSAAGSAGQATAVKTGTATITATYNALSGTATLTAL
jgi:uncharacterized protein YjdB